MLRLDPHLAVFRSAPDRIVIGAQQPVVELDADESTLRGIAALTRGVVRRELEHLLGDDPAAELLEAVEPALQLAPPLLPVLVRGRIPLAEALHRAARQAGHPRAGSRAPGEALLVPVAAWRLPDAESQRLLAAGDAHLPVVVGDVWVQVGPFVPAGAGCPLCPAPEQPMPLLPGHLTPAPSAIAAAQAVVTVLGALRRASDGTLPPGWAARIRQRDAAVSAVRRSRSRCPHRSRPGTAMAA